MGLRQGRGVEFFAPSEDVATVREFRSALLDSEQFRIVLAEKLMVYALGRGLEPYDMPAVRAIVRDAAAEEHHFSQFILGVVNSAPFTMRRAAL